MKCEALEPVWTTAQSHQNSPFSANWYHAHKNGARKKRVSFLRISTVIYSVFKVQRALGPLQNQISNIMCSIIFDGGLQRRNLLEKNK
jgi:hypothetical protein